MAEAFTELSVGTGGSKMDEREVPNDAAGGTAHRTTVIPGDDAGLTQSFVDDEGTVKAHVTDTDVRSMLLTIDATLMAIGAELAQKTEPANAQHVIVDSLPAGGGGLTDSELRATPVPVSGPLTDTQLRASAVPVSAASLPLPTGAATEATLATRATQATLATRSSEVTAAATLAQLDVALSTRASQSTLATRASEATVATLGTEATLATRASEATLATRVADATVTARLNTLGQKTSANSAPVVIASDQSAVPVSAAALPLPAGAATEATLATRASEATLATRASEATLATLGTEVTLASRLADATFTGRINTQGQKAMAASTPVVIANDQSAVPVSAVSLPLPTGAATETTLATLATESTLATRLADATLTARLNTLGQKTMANSAPVVLASDQASITTQGGAARDLPVAGNPNLMGARASATAPSSVSSNGDAVDIWALRNGTQVVGLASAGELILGDAANGLDVDVTRLPAGMSPTILGQGTMSEGIRVVLPSDQSAISVTTPNVSTSRTLDTSLETVTLTLGDKKTAVMQWLNGGTYVGTLTLSVTYDGILFTNTAYFRNPGSGLSTTVVPAGAIGSFGILLPPGAVGVRVTANPYTSGSIDVYLIASDTDYDQLTSSGIGTAMPPNCMVVGYDIGPGAVVPRAFDLDSGAGTQYVAGASLRRSGSGGSTELIGQQTMANSLPVVIASDQVESPVRGTLANGLETVINAVAAQVIAANATRKYLAIQNTGTANIRVGVAGVTATTGIRLTAGATWTPTVVPTSAIFAIREGANNSVALGQEMT